MIIIIINIITIVIIFIAIIIVTMIIIIIMVIMIIMMMDGEEDMEEEVVAEDVVDTIDMMKTMVVAMTMEVHPEEKTRKTGFPIILSIFCLKMTPWPPEHCSSATWSSTSRTRR